MPGLPVLDSVTETDVENIGRLWRHQPSESRFDVPARSQLKRRRAGKRQRR